LDIHFCNEFDNERKVRSGSSSGRSHDIVKRFYSALVHALLKTLKRKSIALSIPNTGGDCLALVLQLRGSDTMKLVSPFAVEN
jgi:hypothetical protein